MLDDDFPAMSTIMKVQENPSFQQRQHWERLMRVKFSKTIRTHMRNEDMYTRDNVWSEHEANIADAILSSIREQPEISDEDTISHVTANSSCDTSDIEHVLNKLSNFPHMFAVAHARGDIDAYELNGSLKTRLKASIGNTDGTPTHISYAQWKTPLHDCQHFISSGELTESMFGFFLQLFRKHLPPHIVVHDPYAARARRICRDYLCTQGHSKGMYLWHNASHICQRPNIGLRTLCFTMTSVQKSHLTHTSWQKSIRSKKPLHPLHHTSNTAFHHRLTQQ